MNDAEAWLLEHAIKGEAVLSWVNPEHPGYAYPEAAGLFLRWCGRRPRLLAAAAGLRRELHAGTLGRDGSRYTFDTGVALTGLEAFAPEDGSSLDAQWAEVAGWLREKNIVSGTPAPRWSSVAGPHLLKLAVGASAIRPLRPGRSAVLQALQDWPFTQHPDGRISTPPHTSSYLHAHAYAAEGLLASARSYPAHRAMGEQAVAFLAKAQRPDGALPAWHDGRRSHGPGRADTTAQALRLFLLIDASGLDAHIRRGLAFLDRLSTAQGVVRYDESTEDLNTWATLFALQARAWASRGPGSVTELL